MTCIRAMMEVCPIHSAMNMSAKLKTAQCIAMLLLLACQALLACWHSRNPALNVLCLRTGVFNEPLSDLMKVLASLVDAENRILVPGFLDKVRLDIRSCKSQEPLHSLSCRT